MGQLVLRAFHWLKIWEWRGRIANVRKSWHEMKEALGKRRVAEFRAEVAQLGLATAEFEENVARTIREIRRFQDMKRNEHPYRHITLDIRPALGEDVDVFDEAMRRIHYAWVRIA